MSIDDLKNDPYMEEYVRFTTIAKVIVQQCFQGWAFGTPKQFPFDGKKAGLQALELCHKYCQGDNSFPQPGILTTVLGDDVPTHPEGEMSTWDDFVPAYNSKAKYTGKVNVVGDYPYDLVLAGVQANPSVFNKVQWCELSRPIDNVREPGRDKENSKYPHQVYVVEKVFKSKDEAYAAANKTADNEDSFSDFGGDTGGLSAFAQESQWTIETLKKQGQTILNMIAETEAMESPDGKEMTPELAKEIVCKEVKISPEDLDLLDEAPF